MDCVKTPDLYKKYFVDKNDERKNLFEGLFNRYRVQKGIYPGSFVHITPSFSIQDMTYIDSDKRITKFFTDELVSSYIRQNKLYNGDPIIKAYQADYTSELPIEEKSFDIMFSFYAGFISQSCKKYLKNGGLLVCNNSHGDASIAYTDEDYSLIAVIKRKGDFFRITDTKLEEFFIKKDRTPIDVDKVFHTMIGENFTKTGYAYIFILNRKPN